MAVTTTAKAPVESKVKAGAVGAAGGGVLSQAVLWFVGCLIWGASWDADAVTDAVAAVPAPVAALLAAGLPLLIGYAAAWNAKHTFRPDLEDEVEVTVDGAAPVDPGLPEDAGVTALEILVGLTLLGVALLLFGVGVNAG